MNKDFIISDDVVISYDNIQDIAEIITLSAMKRIAIFSDHKFDSMYKGLIRDIYRNGTLTQTYSDGYDYVQEAICFLLEHLGQRLGDMTDRYKRRISIRRKCFCIVNSSIRRSERYYDKLDNIEDYIHHEQPEDEEIEIEECYAEVDDKIAKMKLTVTEKQTLDCYMVGMRFVEIAKFLSVDLSTVWRRRASMKRKYIDFVGL